MAEDALILRMPVHEHHHLSRARIHAAYIDAACRAAADAVAHQTTLRDEHVRHEFSQRRQHADTFQLRQLCVRDGRDGCGNGTLRDGRTRARDDDIPECAVGLFCRG